MTTTLKDCTFVEPWLIKGKKFGFYIENQTGSSFLVAEDEDGEEKAEEVRKRFKEGKL